MHKVAKLLGISLLVFGLAACDGGTKDRTVTSGQTGQQVSLLGSRLMFTLPAGMADKSGELSNQANNVHVYADSTDRRAVLVIRADKAVDSLEMLAKRLEDTQRVRDANLQVITNKAIEVNGVPLRQLDSIITSAGEKAYSSILIGSLDNDMLTIQVTLPADNLQQAQSEAAGIISTLKLKK
ncbi:DcrB family lipoprotein [Serratia symbiotica]|uniref:Inner membrane lipoprotein DcrB n=1 Tax=Serratia symbiotica TaxID=138074 RepID=A0A068YYM1_9GAMM|nr:DcrB family lipoprotein [Serratia symbiotica]QLH61819.1 DcrB family lipoprotein [Serratia symbiotica]CDS56698.1 periplasmic protein [Serratia symbiotica]